MKNLILLLLVGSLFLACKETEKIESNNSDELELQFDEELSKKYGADEYGMKKFVIAFLKRGPNRSQDSILRAQLQKAHMDNINKLANDGKLILAGPFFGNEDLRGIYIFDVRSIEEAKKLTETDPAIQAGSLVMDLKEWYGSAALMGINKLHKKIAKKEF